MFTKLSKPNAGKIDISSIANYTRKFSPISNPNTLRDCPLKSTQLTPKTVISNNIPTTPNSN